MAESLEVQWVKTDAVIPYASNPRQNEASVDKVVASLKEFGWRQPIVVDSENVIVVGHTRYAAARRLNLKQVPVHVATGLTSAQVKAYRIADNRTHEDSTWDYELLSLEIEGLKDLDDSVINSLGFDDGEIDRILEPWEADRSVINAAGDHLDGISVKIVVTCHADNAEHVRSLIHDALADEADVDIS